MNIPKQKIALALATSMALSNLQVFANDYKDIQAHWAKDTIYSFKEQGYIDGYREENFLPNRAITRAELITMLNRSMGLEGRSEVSFSDVPEGSELYNELSIAVANGYIAGFSDGSFRPDAPVSRGEICVFLERLNKIPKESNSSQKIKDMDKVPQWAKSSVQAAANANLIKGYENGNFALSRNLTRAETIAILSNSKSMENEESNAWIIRSESDIPKDRIIKKNVILSEEVKDKNLLLDGLTIQGDLILRGEGSDPIRLKNTKISGEVRVNRKNAQLIFSGESSARQIRVFTDATIGSENLKNELSKVVVSKQFVGESVQISAPTGNLQVYKETNIHVKENIREMDVFLTQKQVHLVVDENKSVGKIKADETDRKVLIEKSVNSNAISSEKKKEAPASGGGGGGGGGGSAYTPPVKQLPSVEEKKENDLQKAGSDMPSVSNGQEHIVPKEPDSSSNMSPILPDQNETIKPEEKTQPSAPSDENQNSGNAGNQTPSSESNHHDGAGEEQTTPDRSQENAERSEGGDHQTGQSPKGDAEGAQDAPSQGNSANEQSEQIEPSGESDADSQEDGKDRGDLPQTGQPPVGSDPAQDPSSPSGTPVPPVSEKTPEELEREQEQKKEEEARKQKEREKEAREAKARDLTARFGAKNPVEQYTDREGNIRIILWTQGITPPTMKNDFRLNKPEEGYEEYQAPYRSGHNWYDINKTSGTQQDDYLCFASVSANMLHWWYDQNSESIQRYIQNQGQDRIDPSSEAESQNAEGKNAFRSSLNAQDYVDSFNDPSDSGFMKLFIRYFGHLKDGFNSDILADLMINGYRPKDDGSPHAKEKEFRNFTFDKRGGLFYPVFGDEPLTQRFFSGDFSVFGRSIQTELLSGKIIGLEHGTSGKATHIITLWGAEYDIDGNITAIYITDSDDESYTNVAMRRFDVVNHSGKPHLSTKIDKKGGAKIEYIQTLSQGKELWEAYFKQQNL